MLRKASNQDARKEGEVGAAALRARRERKLRLRRAINWLTTGIVRLVKWFRELFVWAFTGLVIISFLPLDKCTLEESDISLSSFHPPPPEAIPSFTTIPRPVKIHTIARVPNGLALIALGTHGVVRSLDNGQSWSATRLAGPPADPTSITVTPRGTLLAWGNSRMIRSTDGGASWTYIADNQNENAPDYDVIAAPDGTLFGRGSFGKLSRSTDDGLTWSTPAGEPSTSDSLKRICIDHAGGVVGVGSNGVILRASARDAKWTLVKDSGTRDDLYDVIAAPDGSLVAVGKEIVRSTDGGATWRAILKAGSTFTKVQAYGDTLIAIGEAIARSGDGGASWSVVESRYADLTNIMAEPNGALLAVGWYGQLVRSTDLGKSWVKVHPENRIHPMLVRLVAPDGALLASGVGPVMRSVDGGANWSRTRGAGLSDWKPDAGTATLSPLSSVAGAPGGIFVAVGASGTIVRSIDDGKTWMDIDTGQFSAPLTRVIHLGQGDFVGVGGAGVIVRSDDMGAHWSILTDVLGDYELDDVVAGADRVVVAVGGAIVRSADHGRHWQPAAYKGPPIALQSVVVTPKHTFVAVGARGGSDIGALIVRSTDGGLNWTAVENVPAGFGLMHVTVETGGALVAVGRLGTVVRSTDDGRTWDKVVSTSARIELSHVFAGPDRLLVAVGEHAWIIRSNDGGQTWSSARGTGGIGRNLMSVAAQPSGTLVAVGENNIILRSSDRGASWSVLPTEDGNNLQQVSITRDGTILAVGGSEPSPSFSLGGGEAIITRGAPSKIMAPSIRQITHSYSASGVPQVHIRLDDPAGLCPKGECVTARARSFLDNKNDVEPRVLPAHLISSADAGVYKITVDPSLLSANSPDKMFMQIGLAGKGFSTTYPNGDAYFPIPNNPHPMYRQKWFLSMAVAVSAMALLYATLLLRPLWLLGLASRPAILDTVPKAGLPGIGSFITAAVSTLVLPVLSRHPKVLNAWVAKHARALADGFNAAVQNVSEGGLPYTALPFDSPERSRIIPSPATLTTYFRARRTCVQIVGQGGVGKTTMALEIGRWLYKGELNDHPAAALFIDEEFGDLLPVVQAKLSAMLAEEVPPYFLKALLSSGRLWLIVDRVSERSVATRSAFSHLYRTMSPRVVISTARYIVDVDGQKLTVLRPRPLDSTTLLSFLSDQLASFDSLQLFPRLGDQSVLVQRLARQIALDDDELPITPLLVRVFVTRAVELVRCYGIGGLDKMPDSVPEAYFNYVERLDVGKRVVENGQSPAPELLRRAAALVAYVELGGDFRPKQVALAAVEEALRAEPRLAGAGIEYVRRLEENGLLVRRVHGTEPTVEYLLDPLAECLAAFEYARLCGGSAERWAALVEQVAAKGTACNGFMLALRINQAAYRTAFRFPPVAFPENVIGVAPCQPSLHAAAQAPVDQQTRTRASYEGPAAAQFKQGE
jgi:photosystem II stability/assembly factor-like uncharacterized protein